MTCKDCLYYEACQAYQRDADCAACERFKNKALYMIETRSGINIKDNEKTVMR